MCRLLIVFAALFWCASAHAQSIINNRQSVGTTAGTVAAGDDARIIGAGQTGSANAWTGLNTFNGGVTLSGLNSATPFTNTFLDFPLTTITDNDASHGYHAWQDRTTVSTTTGSSGWISGLCNPTLTGPGTMINFECLIWHPIVAAGYTGAMPVPAGVEINDPIIQNGGAFPSILPFVIDPQSNGTGITSGTVIDYGFKEDAPTADAGDGGSVTVPEFQANMGTGVNAGTTYKGFEVRGNCNAGPSCWAFYSAASTAPSQLGGSLTLGGSLSMGGNNILNGASIIANNAAGYQINGSSCVTTTTTIAYIPDKSAPTTGIGCNGVNGGLSAVVGGTVIGSWSAGGYTMASGGITQVDTTPNTLTGPIALAAVTAGIWNGSKIGLAYGGTNADLSATGGAHQVLKQSSTGAPVTVSALDGADLPQIKYPVTMNNYGGVQVAGTTQYYPISGPSIAINLPEGNANQSWPMAGTFAVNAGCGTLQAQPSGTETATFTLRVNGATPVGGPVCTFTGSSKIGVGSGGPVTVAVNDVLDWVWVQSASSAASKPTLSLVFSAQP